jgi:hypothetical protein
MFRPSLLLPGPFQHSLRAKPLGVGVGFCIGAAALAAPAVNDDAGTVAVRTKDAIVQFEGIFFFRLFPGFLGKRSAAFHTEAALVRDMGAAARAKLSFDFFVTMGAFHNGISFSSMFSLERG